MSSTHDQKTSQLIATIDSELESIEQAMPTVYCNEGDRLLARKEYAGAMEHYNKALEIDSEHAPALFARGNVYVEQGDIELAIEDLRRAANLAPDSRAVEVYAETLKMYITCMEEEVGRRRRDSESYELVETTEPPTALQHVESSEVVHKLTLEESLTELARVYDPEKTLAMYRSELVQRLSPLQDEGIEKILDSYLIECGKIKRTDWSSETGLVVLPIVVGMGIAMAFFGDYVFEDYSRNVQKAAYVLGLGLGSILGFLGSFAIFNDQFNKWDSTYYEQRIADLGKKTKVQIEKFLEEKNAAIETSVETEVVAK